MTTGAGAPDGSGGGVWFSDDFTSANGLLEAAGALTFPSAISQSIDGYRAYVDIGSSAARVSDVTGGVLRLSGDNVDNDMIAIGTGDLLEISDTAGSDKLTIFECRIALPSISATSGSRFIGLGNDEVIADDGLIDDTGALITAGGAAIGFSVLDAAAGAIDFTYGAAGQVSTVKTATIQTAVAGTFYKLGFVYNPRAVPSKRITAFVDNVESSTYITATNIAAALFPDGEYMGLAAAVKTDATTVASLDIDWWAVYQEA